MTGDRGRWIGAAIIVAVAVLRCCTSFLPQNVFESDPAAGPIIVASLAMGGSLLLDAILILACGIALLGEWRSGRGLDPLLMMLALLPLPVILWHGAADAGNAWVGSTWFAAAFACATIAHLARERALRIAITAALLAVIAPLLIRGVVQMTWEHDATAAEFERTKEAFFAARGWESDSPAARIYERRLMHREPTGWFTSTNIYGSIMGAAAVMLVGLTVFAFKAHRAKSLQSGTWFLMAALALACAIALRFTTSMGAMLATLAGAIMLATLGFAQRGRARDALPRWIGALLLAMVFGATLGVIVRGAILPESFLNEKSLLFRWHYLQAATGMVNESPWLGAGPSGFQLKYMLHRVPRNPEEVQSAHAMFTDWVATLGVLGGAWVAMIITLIVRSGGSPERSMSANESNSAESPKTARFAVAVALLALTPALIVELPAIDATDVFLRCLAAMAFVALAAIVGGLLAMMSDAFLRSVTIAGVCVLLVHGQIETTFFMGGSVVWMMAMTGLVGFAQPARAAIVNSLCALGAVLAAIGASAWLVWSHALPALAQEAAMLDAARMLDKVRENPGSIEIALRQRPLAAERLVEAYAMWPINNQPINAAVEQLLLAAETPVRATSPDGTPLGRPIGLLLRAEELGDRAALEHDSPSSIAHALNAHIALAITTDDRDQWTLAIALARRLTQIDPHSVGAWTRLGDVLWAAGAKPEAAAAYRTALTNNNNFALDPLKQLSADRRAELLDRSK